MKQPYLSTFSIVARDPETGNFGIAGATHWYGYGRLVPHLRSGVGAIATQAETNVWYSQEGLDLLSKGLNARDALHELLKVESDPGGIYQFAIMDKDGNTAAYTGKQNHFFAGHIVKPGLAIAGNTLANDTVLKAVEAYYIKSKEPFGLRLIHSLIAGQKAGGDIRGKLSAALKIVMPLSTGHWWDDIVNDIRVDEHKEPLKELERLYYANLSFNHIDLAQSAQDPSIAISHLEKALELYPDNSEALFNLALYHHLAGNITVAKRLKATLIRNHGTNWSTHWDRVLERKSHLLLKEKSPVVH